MKSRIKTEAEFMQALDGLKRMECKEVCGFFWDVGHDYAPAKEALTAPVLSRIADEFVQPSGHDDLSVNSRSVHALRTLVSRADQAVVMPVLEKLETIAANREVPDDIRSNVGSILRDSAVYKQNLTPERVTRLLDIVEQDGKGVGAQIVYMLNESAPSKYGTPRPNPVDLAPHAEQLARIAAKPDTTGWKTGELVRHNMGDVLERANPSPKPQHYQDPKRIAEYGELVESAKSWMEPDEFNRLSVKPGEALVTVVRGFRTIAMVTSGRRGEYETMFKSYMSGEYGEIQTYRVPHVKLAMQ